MPRGCRGTALLASDVTEDVTEGGSSVTFFNISEIRFEDERRLIPGSARQYPQMRVLRNLPGSVQKGVDYMDQQIKVLHKEPGSCADTGGMQFTVENAGIVRAFHKSIPGYEPTPLASLGGLARYLGLAGLYVKDESFRFGLNAFKGLGGSFCLAKYIAGKLGMDIRDLDYSIIASDQTRKKIGEITFVTATDGNHGRGIAWTAKMLGQKAVVYLPKGSAQERVDNIRILGADVQVTDWNYDETVAFAWDQAEKNGWVLVQDTDREGYEEIPAWIMQGYMTLGLEAAQQLGDIRPTHIFLQAGVGAMAGSLAGFFADYYKGHKPVITIVEPDNADCMYRTALANDGLIHAVDGDLKTIMAGLACGVPCKTAWKELDRLAEYFVSMPDRVAAAGMRVLGNPMDGDPRVISGESGASTTGFVYELMRDPGLEEYRKQIGLDEDSVVLCISTEGATDRENYRHIVWDGWYAG